MKRKSLAAVIIHGLPHASPCCACGWNELNEYFIDPICLTLRRKMGPPKLID